MVSFQYECHRKHGYDRRNLLDDADPGGMTRDLFRIQSELLPDSRQKIDNHERTEDDYLLLGYVEDISRTGRFVLISPEDRYTNW